MRPPINPSMVLFGLSLGRNEFFPRFLPIIYAPVSKTAILKITANRNILDPVTNCKHTKQKADINSKPIQKLLNAKFYDNPRCLKNI